MDLHHFSCPILRYPVRVIHHALNVSYCKFTNSVITSNKERKRNDYMFANISSLAGSLDIGTFIVNRREMNRPVGNGSIDFTKFAVLEMAMQGLCFLLLTNSTLLFATWSQNLAQFDLQLSPHYINGLLRFSRKLLNY